MDSPSQPLPASVSSTKAATDSLSVAASMVTKDAVRVSISSVLPNKGTLSGAFCDISPSGLRGLVSRMAAGNRSFPRGGGHLEAFGEFLASRPVLARRLAVNAFVLMAGLLLMLARTSPALASDNSHGQGKARDHTSASAVAQRQDSPTAKNESHVGGGDGDSSGGKGKGGGGTGSGSQAKAGGSSQTSGTSQASSQASHSNSSSQSSQSSSSSQSSNHASGSAPASGDVSAKSNRSAHANADASAKD